MFCVIMIFMMSNNSNDRQKWSSSSNRVGAMPALFPMHFYLRALLPRWLGGQPVCSSVARSGLYDPEHVRRYLEAEAGYARVQGNASRVDEISDLIAHLARALPPL